MATNLRDLSKMRIELQRTADSKLMTFQPEGERERTLLERHGDRICEQEGCSTRVGRILAAALIYNRSLLESEEEKCLRVTSSALITADEVSYNLYSGGLRGQIDPEVIVFV